MWVLTVTVETHKHKWLRGSVHDRFTYVESVHASEENANRRRVALAGMMLGRLFSVIPFDILTVAGVPE